MQKQKVFIPVSVEDELPGINTFYNCIVTPNEYNTNTYAECFFYDGAFSIKLNDRFINVTHWLKEQEGYFFTADHLEDFSIGLMVTILREFRKDPASFSPENVFMKNILNHLI